MQLLFLTFPLIWYVELWLDILFQIRFYDVEASPDVTFYWVVMLFIGTPITLMIGLLYTWFKKLWWWFGAYVLLGGGIFFSAMVNDIMYYYSNS